MRGEGRTRTLPAPYGESFAWGHAWTCWCVGGRSEASCTNNDWIERDTSIERGKHVYTHIVVVVARAHALLGKLDLIPRRHKQLVNVLRAPNELGLADKSIRVGGEETKGGLGQASRGGGETSHRGDVGGGGETSEGGGGGGGEGGGEPGTAQVARTGEAAADHTGCVVWEASVRF